MLKNIKRVATLMLSVVMVAGICACVPGCGGSKVQPRRKDGEKVTIKWDVGYNDQEDTEKVLKAVNEKLQNFERTKGITLELTSVNPENYVQQMAAGDEMDIVWTGYSYKMAEVVESNGYLPLNDYITKEEYPNLYKEWKEDYTDEYYSGTYIDSEGNETLYAIPDEQPLISETPYIQIPASTFKCFDVARFRKAAAKSPYLTKEFMDVIDDYLATVWKKHLYDTDTVGHTVAMKGLYDIIAMRGYESVGTAPVCYKLFNDDGSVVKKAELVDFAQTDEYKLFCDYAAKWYDKGYIAKDSLTSAEGGGGSLEMVIYAHSNGKWFKLDDAKNGIKKNYDKFGTPTNCYINIEPKDLSHKVQGVSTFGSEATYQALAVTCKHPYDALDVLELFRTPAYKTDDNGEYVLDDNGNKVRTDENLLLNMLCYGFEENSEEAKETGTYHYTLGGEDNSQVLNTDYTAQPDANSKYGITWWKVANVYLTYRTTAWDAGQNEYALDYEHNRLRKCAKSPLYRFREDISSINDTINYVNNVRDEYHSTLTYGVKGQKGYEKVLKEYIEKRKAKGIDTILEEMQKQVDNYKYEEK